MIDSEVLDIKKSTSCNGEDEQEFLGKVFVCDSANTTKTRIDIYANDQLGLLTHNEQVVISYSSNDNTDPGGDLELLEKAALSFRAISILDN